MLCRPPNNRDPEPYEVAQCRHYLERQLELVKPELIITFGRFSASMFLKDFKITRDHGKIQKCEKYGVSVCPLYHPAYAGCYGSQKVRDEFKQDVDELKKIIKE